MYIDENLPTHPKILRAGLRLGDDGPAIALGLYLLALSYSRKNVTDGFIPDAFLVTSGTCKDPRKVAKVLASKGVGLWHRRRGGYTIHDFHDFNKSASEIKKIRAGWRRKKAEQRRTGNGQYHDAADLRVSPMSRGDKCPHRDSRARTRSNDLDPVRTSTNKPLSKDPGEKYLQRTNRSAVLKFRTKTPKTATRRVLCSMVHAEIDADPSGMYADWIEGVKVRLARQGFAYATGDALDSAFQSVDRVRARRAAGGRR